MKTGNALSVVGLCLTLTFSGHGTAVQLPEPAPVDCLYSSWSEWTPCNPCTEEMRRSRGIEAFGQFGGRPCKEPLGESQVCVTDVACRPPPAARCSAADHQCASGACIKRRQLCNYDYDCEDQSDEQNCNRMAQKPCGSRPYDANDAGRSAMGQGINILGPTPPKNILYNGYFNGACQIVSGIRLPWNVAGFNLETHAEKVVSSDVYESRQLLVHKVLTETNYDGGRSFKSNPLSTKSIGNESFVEATRKRKKYILVNGKVRSATYRLRPRDLRVSNNFSEGIWSLPVEYEKGSYFDFLEDYGTHYTRSGKLGGKYSLMYVLDAEEIRRRKLTDSELLQCFEDFSSNPGVGATGNAKSSSCNLFEKVMGKAVVEEVLISGNGGDAASVSAMKAKINTDGRLSAHIYQNWVQSVTKEPALLYSEREPIYNIVPLGMPDANTKISNLKRAIEDYVAEYNICKCKPCHNNGTLVLLDGMCSCFCALGSNGLACQNREAEEEPGKESPSVSRPSVSRPSTPRSNARRTPARPTPARPTPARPTPTVPGPVPHEGNWACWTDWSICSDTEQRHRSRVCNTEGLLLGMCSGTDRDSQWC